jgi:hypothetical protein
MVAGQLGGAITASFLGAGAANASPNEYVGKTPDQLVQETLQRAASLPAGQVQAAHQAFVAGDDAKAQSILIDLNDSPLWAADPTIEAAAQVLPKPIGGTNGDSYTSTPGGTNGLGGPDADGSLMQFRNTQVLAARDNGRKNVVAGEANAAKVRDAVKKTLGK